MRNKSIKLSNSQKRQGRGYARDFLDKGGFRLWAATLTGMTAVAFLGLTVGPTITDEAKAVTANAEMSVGVNEVLSLRIVEQNPSTGEWDVDTNTISTEVTHGSFAHQSVKVIASTNGAGGYRLSVSDVDNNSDLASTIVTDTIPALSSNVTLSGADDPGEVFPVERWGYNWVKDGDTVNYTYMPMPLSNATAQEKQKDSTSDVGVGTYTFTLGVRVAEDTPAVTYADQIMFTLVGNPSPTAPLFYRTEYMQDFNQTICNTVDTPGASVTTTSNVNGYDYTPGGNIVPSTIVKDRRDEQEYTVRKLADGNCWMTENLRLGKLGGVTLDSTNSNLTSGRTFSLPAATTTAGASWGNQDAYPFVFYRDSNPGAGSSPSGIVADGPSALYNWYTATAGARDSSGNSLMTAASGQAADSVCPKNWQLPVNGSGYGTSKSYMNLVYLYTGATGNSGADTSSSPAQAAINQERIAKLVQAPTSFVFSDFYNYGGTLYSRPIGLYWSSTVSSATYSYDLVMYVDGTTRNLYPQYSNSKGLGFAVRCVVQ